VNGPTPLLDFFKRGEVARDVRLLAAQGALGLRAHEQLAILVLLVDDPDPTIGRTADDTLRRIPEGALRTFLARPDVPISLREFFGDRGIFPDEIPPILGIEDEDQPLIDTAPTEDPVADKDGETMSTLQQLASMSFTDRLKAAIRGSREVRAILIRDTNKMISAAVLSGPKVTPQEVEVFARMTNVSEDVLRVIGNTRAWIKNYGVVVALAKNPKTPIALSLNLMTRLHERDLATLAVDRNVPDPLRVAARRRVVAATSRK
jgi:hypothetical protein